MKESLYWVLTYATVIYTVQYCQVLTRVSFFRGNGDPILQEHGLLIFFAIGYVYASFGLTNKMIVLGSLRMC